MSEKTAFISGHIDLTLEEFNTHYKPELECAMDEGCTFVVGDANGADFMTQQYLYTNYDHDKVTVYHMLISPLNNVGFKTKGGFKNHSCKDTSMTNNSDFDIAYVRPPYVLKKLLGTKYDPKRKSGTQKNIERRNKLV